MQVISIVKTNTSVTFRFFFYNKKESVVAKLY